MMLTREELKDKELKKRIVFLGNIMFECCLVVGVDMMLVKSKKRTQKIMFCRSLFCFFAYGYTTIPLSEIERFIGLSHSSILFHHKKCNTFIFNHGEKIYSDFYQRFNTEILHFD